MIEENTKPEDIQDLLQQTKGKETIVVCNKVDKMNSDTFVPPITPLLYISAKTGFNIDQLEAKLFEAAKIPELSDHDIIVTSARQYDTLLRAHQNLDRVLSGLQTGLSGDLISEDLRLVLDDLADITGEGRIMTNEVLGNIFSHFCVGK
jgi:tRNA modification GTPase